jgi:alkaline phosphatase
MSLVKISCDNKPIFLTFAKNYQMRFILPLVFVASQLMAQPRNVIIFIGDGYGISAKTAARMALGQGQQDAKFSDQAGFHVLNADKLSYQGTLTTHSANSWITDSAPGSTVYACGKRGKVHNEAIAFDLYNMQAIETVLEQAKKAGYAVGVVTTTRVTHATPADFTSHSWNRDLENEIAAQMISSTQAEYAECYGAKYDSAQHWVLPEPKVGVDIDVIMGGGARHYLPQADISPNAILRDAHGHQMREGFGKHKIMKGSREQNVDLIELAKNRGYTYVNTREALSAIDLNKFKSGGKEKLLGLFNRNHLEYEHDRQMRSKHEPTLAEMTRIAIEVLKRKGGDKGFFLMVEGGRIDHLEHANSGGIVVRDSVYHIGCDHEVASPDEIYDGINRDTSGNYGSDYLIKEVVAFDHAIGEGRKLLKDTLRNTLIFSTSDHECGGLALIALHDKAMKPDSMRAQVRTYAEEPKQTYRKSTSINPIGVKPGAPWFPEYEMYQFQGYSWPRPKCDTCRRIVISYGSNPVVNGNGRIVGATPGNHTPQDVWVGCEDNLGGKFASKITGRGQLDNTDLTPIMQLFLGLKVY